VEDEVNIIKLFEFNLKRAGFEVCSAANGKEALEKVWEVKPDLILSDIMMPEMDGFEFRKELMKDEFLKTIPFVFLTAKGADEDILEGYDLDIQDYIIKTSSTKVVIAKINAIIASYKKEREKVIGEVQSAAGSMQASFVPAVPPYFEGYEINHWHQTFQGIPGGDFIDYFQLDEENLIVVLGDVMGKKWGAYYFAIAYAGYIRSAVRFILQSADKFSPGQIIEKVNESVFKDERISEVYITLSVLLLNKNGTVKYSGAGDLPLFYKSDKVDYIKSDGILLGYFDISRYKDYELKLNPGNEIYLMTDGIFEARNEEGIQLAVEGFTKIISSKNDENDTLDEIKKEFDAYTNKKYEDDISIIAVKKI
jgi:sigma-B regulation protein RsbU (phosphoserine phosphatase)